MYMSALPTSKSTLEIKLKSPHGHLYQGKPSAHLEMLAQVSKGKALAEEKKVLSTEVESQTRKLEEATCAESAMRLQVEASAQALVTAQQDAQALGEQLAERQQFLEEVQVGPRRTFPGTIRELLVNFTWTTRVCSYRNTGVSVPTPIGQTHYARRLIIVRQSQLFVE